MPSVADVAHLLRRTGFGSSSAEVDARVAQPLETTVDQLLDFSSASVDVEPAFLTEDRGDWEKEFMLQAWWLDRMANSTAPLQEKLTLFWHNHFATANHKVGNARLMYEQNALFRRRATGSFRVLVQEMALQPAMLIWLDNDPNEKGRPNENFARELLELFVLGVNQYTQQDIAESARAWTGHNTDDDDCTVYRFYPERHDDGPKTFMGVTRSWDGPEIVDFLLRDEPTKKRIAARFIAKKLWSHFAYPNPETALLDELTDVFVASDDLDVGTLMRAILLHPQFYSAKAKQGLVRGPAEWVAASLRVLGISAVEANPQWWMDQMGQELFEPPNVSGWRQNGYWLTTTGCWGRANWARHVTWKARTRGFLADTKAMAPADAVQRALDVFGVDTPSSETRSRLEAWRTAQHDAASEWRDWRFINLITLMLLAPEMNVA